jgi:RHS repeat-associated protein
LGTYDRQAAAAAGTVASNLHFYLDDPLGTRRAQTDYAGVIEQTCSSLPYGDALNCTGGNLSAPTEHHFTGKERDTESGNDYFGARYYASSMGRFMSPDWSAKEEPVPYAKLDNPQSLNLYAYVLNNPLSRVDADGHDDKTPEKIVAAAKASENSQSYDINRPNVSNGQFFRPGTDKCNEYVSDTVKSADGVRPVNMDTGKIPTAAQFADPNVKIQGLSDPKPLSEAKPGDVIAQDHGANPKSGNEEGHVGIVVEAPHDGQPGRTASANANEGGKVTINTWGFRSPTATPNNGERNGAASPPPVVRHPL